MSLISKGIADILLSQLGMVGEKRVSITSESRKWWELSGVPTPLIAYDWTFSQETSLLNRVNSEIYPAYNYGATLGEQSGLSFNGVDNQAVLITEVPFNNNQTFVVSFSTVIEESNACVPIVEMALDNIDFYLSFTGFNDDSATVLSLFGETQTMYPSQHTGSFVGTIGINKTGIYLNGEFLCPLSGEINPFSKTSNIILGTIPSLGNQNINIASLGIWDSVLDADAIMKISSEMPSVIAPEKGKEWVWFTDGVTRYTIGNTEQTITIPWTTIPEDCDGFYLVFSIVEYLNYSTITVHYDLDSERITDTNFTSSTETGLALSGVYMDNMANGCSIVAHNPFEYSIKIVTDQDDIVLQLNQYALHYKV